MDHQFEYQNPSDPTRAIPTARAGKFATASLVLGICSVVSSCCCCILLPVSLITGILAVIFAVRAKRENNGMLPGKATAGMVLGIIGLVLFLLTMIFLLAAVLPILANPEAPKEYLMELEKIYRDMGIEVDFSGIYETLG